MNIAAQETIWLRNLMCEINAALTGLDYNTLIDDTPEEDIHETTLYPTMICCDNLGSVFTAANPNSSGRSKHVDVRHLKIREWQEAQRLIVKHIDGKENIADMFTKPIEKGAFQNYCRLMGMRPSGKQNDDAHRSL